MRKKKTKKTGLVALLLILVLLISIGYAALSTNLSITGNATIKKQTWSVYFNNVVLSSSNNVASVTTAPTVPEGSKTTTELNWEVSMDTPGQVYEFTVDVVNEGSMDAMIETATDNIVGSALTADQKKYLDYTITYLNGAEIEQYDKLAAGETKTIKVRLLFKQDVNASDLPSTDQSGLSLSYTTNYIQADNRAVTKLTKTPLTIGSTVNYSTTLNGVTLNNWKVFYVDGNYTYLILENYLPNAAIDTTSMEGLGTKGTYYVYGTKDDTIRRTNLLNAMTTKSNWDSLLVGTLNGTTSVNETRTENVWAMGSPTIELYVNSWNESYPDNKLYTAPKTMADGFGYYLGTSENPDVSNSHIVDMSNSDGFHNTLYYPGQVGTGNEGCSDYWFASGGAGSTNRMKYVASNGYIDDTYYYTEGNAFRPVICLPTSVVNQ